MNLESISLAEAIMADADVELKKRRTFRKFTYRLELALVLKFYLPSTFSLGGSTLTSSLT